MPCLNQITSQCHNTEYHSMTYVITFWFSHSPVPCMYSYTDLFHASMCKIYHILYIVISFVELYLSSLRFGCNFRAIALVVIFMVWLILQVMSMKTKWKKAGLSHLSLVASCQLVHDTSGRCAPERLWKWLNMASGQLALLKDQIPNHKPFVYLNMCTSLDQTAYSRVRKCFNAVEYNCTFCSGLILLSRLTWRFFN
jgi:hypothetical protein